MSAFLAILRWEIRYYLRRVSTWVYFGMFFAVALLVTLVLGGAFSEIAAALGTGGNVSVNSPFALAGLIPVISLFGVSTTAAVAGNALYKDHEFGAAPLFYTLPLSRTVFLGGRFAGTVIVNSVIALGVGLGCLAATFMPGIRADHLAPFHAMSYVQPYLTLVLPNLLFTAALFFALVSLTRQMIPNYAGGAILLVGYLAAGSLLGDLDNKHLAALVDPFGLRAQSLLTQYWSIAEKNSRTVPLTGVLLENRIIWLSVAMGILALAVARFRFSHALVDRAVTVPTDATDATPAAMILEIVQPVRPAALPIVTQHFGSGADWVQFQSVFARSFWRIVRSRYFGVIVGGGLLYLLIASRAAGKIYGTTTWPVTYEMESLLSGSFEIFVVVIIAFYSGELVWAERDVRMSQIYDATPVRSSVVFVAKFTALAAVILALLATTMAAGIAMQAAHGYYRFEIPLYIQSLLGFRFADFLLIAALAMAIHVFVNHKYLGHFVVILIYVGMGLLGALGVEHNLYLYGSDAGSTYSDMNGWGPYAWPFVWWKLYWGSFAVLLLLAAQLFWVRGEETHVRVRARLAQERFGRRARLTAVGGGVSFITVGAFLFYNTNSLNTYRSAKAERHLRADRERLYKRFERVAQPRIVGITLRVDLHPSRRDAVITGEYLLRNTTTVSIDSIHLGINEELDIRRLDFDRPATRRLGDRPRQYYIYQLEAPLPPGDSIRMRFELARQVRGFPNEIQDNAVAANGTFLESSLFMPSIGYDARAELTDGDARKKEKLGVKPERPSPRDTSSWANNYISHDADRLTFDAVISTDPDQLAITSGTLQREWMENGRRFFHYRMDSPIVNLWAIQSARYAVKRDRWRDVDIEIDYHAAHGYNVDRMIEAVKASLEYYSANFGPYQHRQLRIVEFPRYATFAQSLPNTIPFSEAIGFIARLENPDDVDYVYYVTAHEVAHQWWAHQVIGADAAGATMLSETMAQYSALMVMEKTFGAANMRKFLEYELNNYLVGRSTEGRRELPLELVENQTYIHYNKGSLAMYALRDYVGEQRMNTAVRGFLKATKFRGPPYPTSLQLVDSLRAATPDSLRYLIADLFETITLFELKTDSAVASRTADGRYSVDLYVDAKKLRADSVGKETELPLADWMDIGVFARAPLGHPAAIDAKVGVPLYLQKHRIRSGSQKITVLVDTLPYRAGIDPLHKLIDRIAIDNTVGVRVRSR